MPLRPIVWKTAECKGSPEERGILGERRNKMARSRWQFQLELMKVLVRCRRKQSCVIFRMGCPILAVCTKHLSITDFTVRIYQMGNGKVETKCSPILNFPKK